VSVADHNYYANYGCAEGIIKCHPDGGRQEVSGARDDLMAMLFAIFEGIRMIFPC